MKAHKIALELTAKKFGVQAEERLPVMYDRALARMEDKEQKSISSNDPFPVNVFSIEFKLGEQLAKVVRVVDVENGRYVKLYRPAPTGTSILETGTVLTIEEITQGQSNIRAW